jgi:TolB-like protein
MIYRWLTTSLTVALLAGAAVAMPSRGQTVLRPTPSFAAAPASGSLAGATSPAPRKTPVALLDLAFYGKRANSLEPGDSLLAGVATKTVRQYLARDSSVVLVDSAAIAAAEGSPQALEAANGKPCNVIVACARAVGRKLGVPWVVMGKVSKTSNLIWIFSGQLIDVASGRLVMDDEYELKGIATDMVPKGALVFARRAAKRIAQGTVASAGAAAGERP